tara:strand:+ start:12507 stop:13865 length:1359 start_codon:yes stop_codon:yes gene_type:complete
MELIPAREDQQPLNAKHEKFYVRLIEGRFQNLRRLISWPLIMMFFGLAWIQIDGQPWLLFSVEQRRIFLFGIDLLWHDLPLLAGALITGAFLLFFIAVGWGRIWCGFACPQSIWTWLFIRVEQFVEGPAFVRSKVDKGPLVGGRLVRRLCKHLLWLVLAIVTAITFTGYFVPIREIFSSAAQQNMSMTLLTWIVIMGGLTYLNAGLVREKICLHACPYARFQSVMFDVNTLTVSYDKQRGEPRASKRESVEQAGDCVDCTMCVQVCPTGIDIRDGLQLGCIDCGACIDACDRVMDILERPKGLIRFASESELNNGSKKWLRPRLLGYGGVLAFGLVGLAYGFSDPKSVVIEVARDRDSLFTQLDDETICNNYRVKIEGGLRGDPMIGVSIAHTEKFELFGPATVDLRENSTSWISYRVCARSHSLANVELNFIFTGKNISESETTTFISKLR